MAVGTWLCALSAQSILELSLSADNLMTSGLWSQTVRLLGGEMSPTADGSDVKVDVPIGSLVTILALVSVASWVLGALWIARRRRVAFVDAAISWGTLGWIWWIVGGSWELARIAAYLSGLETWQGIVLAGPAFWIAAGAAGWLATLLVLADRFSPVAESASDPVPRLAAAANGDDYRVSLPVWLCAAAYLLAFVTMNWQLDRGLLIPHGDSSMYEEHLWNFLHGKGFRSYLDRGLFLGEHVQVIHLLLIPFYVLWPSQMMLELCGSALLAAGCIPVYWIARRHTGDSRAATWLAAAYLLYAPLQYLDIGIDLKTFRPNGFGIPVLLFALDQLERCRYKTFCLLLAVTLSAQEDYAIVLAPLAVWIALRQVASLRGFGAGAVTNLSASKRRMLLFGGGLALFSAFYLFVATRVVMAWFRDWQEIHYAGYFSKFGKTLPEIAWTMLTRPGLVWETFANWQSAIYLLTLLAPVGFLSVFSPGRLAVAAPLFLTLSLNEVIKVSDGPRHHAHAAVVPIVFWSAAAGLATASKFCARVPLLRHLRLSSVFPSSSAAAGDDELHRQSMARGWLARFACLSALGIGVFVGISPVSVAFWDPYSAFYWKKLYLPGRRAELFPRVLAEIPDTSARVASTDFVHPRFTHYARSYDYSDYPRAVSNYEARVPDDTDYIVIDTQHEYSKIKRPDQVRELRDHPDQWELLPDTTEGYFIVLKRKRPTTSANPPVPQSK